MTPRYLSTDGLGRLLSALGDGRRVIAPLATEGGPPVLGPYREGAVLDLGSARAVQPAKTFLFPPRERVAVYGVGSQPEPAPEPEGLVLVGLSACDLRSLRVLDAVFLQGEDRDALYEARRAALIVISADCASPRESCFCTMLGEDPWPTGGFDLNLSPVEGGYVVEAGGPMGEDLIAKHSDLFTEATPEMLAARDASRHSAAEGLAHAAREFGWSLPRKDVLQRTVLSQVWTDAAADCVECAACLFACPTCHCFLLHDHAASSGFSRLRSWDGCAYGGFARVAGGASPRPRIAERFQHRYRHKFEYFLDRYGFEACTGCGRCIDACPGGIDMRTVLAKAEEAA